MPRAKRTDSVRLNLEIRPEVRKFMEKLQEETGAESLTEVVRRSLKSHEDVNKLKKRLEKPGTKLIFRDGDKETEIFFVSV